jgi:hypothetical protein
MSNHWNHLLSKDTMIFFTLFFAFVAILGCSAAPLDVATGVTPPQGFNMYAYSLRRPSTLTDAP